MFDLLDEFYKTHIDELATYLPDGLTTVDITLLKNMNLLEETAFNERSKTLPQCMYAVETEDKVTLYNDYFAAWIIPLPGQEDPETLLLLATLSNGLPQLEIGFSFRGIYNQSKTILRILDKAIEEIRDTEKELEHIVSR